MSNFSRRKLITAGLAATAGVAGLAAASRFARQYGLVPPDSGGFFGPGESRPMLPSAFSPGTHSPANSRAA